MQELSFGCVAVGESVLLSLEVRSSSCEPLELTHQPLDLTGPFSLLNSLPVLPPHGAYDLMVHFSPKVQSNAGEPPTPRNPSPIRTPTVHSNRVLLPPLALPPDFDTPLSHPLC